MKTLNLKYFGGSRFWSVGVTWRHRSRDHWTWHMWFSIGGPLKSCIYLAPLRRYWGQDLDLLGSRDVIGHVTIGLGVGTFLLVVNDGHAISCTGMELRSFKDFGVTSLTCWGHVTSSVMWPMDSADMVSYWWSIGTMRLSCTVTKILGPKDNGVTSLAFWGHVTSSVTWPMDSADMISYWWSIGTKRLSCTVTEI